MIQYTQKFAFILATVLLFSCNQTKKPESVTESTGSTTESVDSTTSQNKIQAEQLKEKLLKIYDDTTGEVRYFYNSIDLNNDGKKEFVTYVVGPLICGTGGCNTLVFTPKENKLKLVANISITNPPVIAAQNRTNEWLDLVVKTSGGGLQSAAYARLKFDGTTYPSNPTVKPAITTKNFQKQQVLIKPFDSFKDGKLLRKGTNTSSEK